MKRIKLILNISAVILAIAGALASRYYMQEDDLRQYIPVNNTFIPVGELGTDYNCEDSTGVCTYYQPDTVARAQEYLPHRKGKYVPVNQ